MIIVPVPFAKEGLIPQNHQTPAAAAARTTDPSTAPPHRTIGGVVAALLTPCRAPGEIDPPSMTRLAAAVAGRGADGLFVGSSTGELPLLDADERAAALDAARAGCPPHVTLYAGVSGTGLKQTIGYARQAAAAGADAVVAMAPFFVRFSQPQLERYMRELADASPVPLYLYHHLRMPTAFEVPTVARLARHGNIAGLKDTSNDLPRLHDLVSATRGSPFAVFQGSEKLLLPSLQAGAAGCVTALATIAPEWHVELLRAVRAPDPAAARGAEGRIVALWDLFSLPPVQASFAHFVHTLKLTAHRRGWIRSAAGFTPGFTPDDAFEGAILQHVTQTGLFEL